VGRTVSTISAASAEPGSVSVMLKRPGQAPENHRLRREARLKRRRIEQRTPTPVHVSWMPSERLLLPLHEAMLPRCQLRQRRRHKICTKRLQRPKVELRLMQQLKPETLNRAPTWQPSLTWRWTIPRVMQERQRPRIPCHRAQVGRTVSTISNAVSGNPRHQHNFETPKSSA